MRHLAALFLLSLWILSSGRAALGAPPAIAGADSRLTSYWEDAAQKEVFVVAGDRYEARLATHPARLLSLRAEGRELLATEGAIPWIELSDGSRLAPAPRDFLPNWEVHTGQKSAPARSSAARMNVWRASPVYWEIHLRDIPFTPVEPASAAPLRVHLVLHAHPDRLHLEFRAEPAGGQGRPVRLGWAFPGADVTEAAMPGSRGALRFGESGAWLLPPGGTSNAHEISAPAAAPWFVFRPAGAETKVETLFEEELNPLPASAFSADRGAWTGYDPASGLYRLELQARRPAFTFDAAHKNPGRRMETSLKAPASAQPRKLTILAATGMGNLPAAVLTDPHGFPRPVPAFVAKNFAGENEEPDDTAFGDILFPLAIGPGEQREHRLIALFQTWGDHALKQVSSIRFFNIYWHLSTGLSETTCFTHAWMHIRDALVSVPDYRPYSGPFLQGQPQHDCFSWPGFLHYETEAGPVRPMYRGTDFHSIAPNLAHFTMRFRTSDDAARLAVEAMEIPHTDEMRTFLRLRYDWDKPAAIVGDARRSFRWLQTFEKNRPRELLWLPAAGPGRVLAVPETPELGGAPLLLAEPLASSAPYAGVHEQRDNFSSLMLVTRLAGSLGGRSVERAHLTAEFDARQGHYAFVSDRPELRLEPGDWLEADVLLMPHGEVTQALHKPERERAHWALRPPRVASVAIGEKVADFPATVRARQDVARFTVTGGLDSIPVVAEGYSASGVPLLWKGDVWQNPQRHGGDGYQVDRDPRDGTFRFTFVYPIRRAEEHAFTVSLLKVSAGAAVARLEDENGLPVAVFDRAAGYSITAPQLFVPGENRVSANSDLVRASGRARELRAAPLRFSAQGETETRLDIAAAGEGRVELKWQGPGGRLLVAHRVPGRSYAVAMEGSPDSTRVARGDEFTLELPAAPKPRRLSIIALR